MLPVELTGSQLVIAAIISIVVGIAYCFFGYRIFRILLGILGFLGGAVGGIAVAQQVTNGETLYLILGGVIGGVIGAVLLIFLYIVGIFLLGAVMGLLLASLLIRLLQAGETLQIILIIALALAGGVLALVLQRVILIIATALSGAASIVYGLAMLIGWDLSWTQPTLSARLQGKVGTEGYIALALWLVLAVAGMLVQFLWTGRKKPAPAAAAGPTGGGGAAPPQVQVLVQQNVPPTPVQPTQQVQPVVPTQQTPPVAQSAAPPAGKFCPQCGQPVTYGAAFCPNCGTSIAALWQ